MTEVERESDKFSVFISYSRDDLEFADQLDIVLDGTGFNVLIDRRGIQGADAWKRRLGEMIRDADTVVFVLTQSSALSQICAWEVEEAARLGKRLIPVLCYPIEGVAVPPPLAELNYIHFYAEQKVPGSGFGSGVVRLTRALSEDPIWLREHTRLLGLANQWNVAGRPVSRLLFSEDIAKAKGWLAERRQTKTVPTALHIEFIRASEDEAILRANAERRQLDEREHLVREAEAAQAERERAIQAAETAYRQLDQITARFGWVAFVALAVVFGVMIYWMRYLLAQDFGFTVLISAWGTISVTFAIMAGILATIKMRDASYWGLLAFLFPPTILVLLLMQRGSPGVTR